MQHWCRQLSALAIVVAAALIAAGAVRADGWGTIKGQVVFAGDKVPERAPFKVDKDQNECLKNGPLLDDRLIINPKNKGVRWAAVYLMSAEKDGFKKPIPIHPSLKEIKKKVVEVDQPCCLFEPHVLAVREGQTLVFKNSAMISHNVKVDPVPSLNQIVPPGKELKIEDLKARNLPLQIACNIHPWMTGKVFVLAHPYFAVTDSDGKFEIKDAPAGNFRLVVWHEEPGWVVGEDKVDKDGKKIPDKNGIKITIKDKETTDLGKIPLKKARQ
jgi:plastocyanin